MSYTHTIRTLTLSLAALLIVTLTGCQDLSVENENSPDRAQVFATPGDIETLAGGTFGDFWASTQWCGQSMMLSTMADAHSASWGNWGMQDMSSRPRVAWNNNPAYSRAASNEDPWFDGYVAISNASDVLRSVANTDAAAFESADVNVARVEAISNFSMGLAYGHIAATYDRAFLVDETTDAEGVATGAVELSLVPYPDVVDFAIARLDRAIQIANNNTFEITAEEDWIFGLDVTNTDLVQIANSYKARYAAITARTPSERESLSHVSASWADVVTWIDNGVTEDFAPIGNDNGEVLEWDCQKFYGSDGATWSRADYRTIGPADESGGYENWLATPVENRNPYATETSDRRIAGPDGGDGTQFIDEGTSGGPFPVARGTYHYSDRSPSKYLYYYDAGANGAMPVLTTEEMNLLRAEALLHQNAAGNAAEVASLIDISRVGNGELPTAAGAPVGSISDEPNPLTPGDVTLWSMLKYEFNLETMLSAAGLNYFTDRGWGDLVEGTPLHFPIPGAELQTLGAQIYTFGGQDGPCAAGVDDNCSAPSAGSSNATKVAGGFNLESIWESADRPRRAPRPTQPR
jgi:hypothetical protein